MYYLATAALEQWVVDRSAMTHQSNRRVVALEQSRDAHRTRFRTKLEGKESSNDLLLLLTT